MKQEDFAKLQDLYKQRSLLDQELEKFQNFLTVSFVDIVGSTRYFEQHGDVAGMIYVHKCIDLLIPEAEKHGGTICKTIGDALMTSYTDPAGAVRAAIDMQLALEAFNKNQPEPERMRVRIGLNFGPGLVKDKDVFGDVVNTAARIEAAAKGDQIFISATLEEKVRDAKIPVQKIPDLAAKGKEKPVGVYEVLWKRDKTGAPISSAKQASPTMAGRTPVMDAANRPPSGTVVLNASAIAELLKKQAVQYSLVTVRPDGTHGQSYKIEKAESILGRVEGDIVFPDDTLVSRRHAKLTITEEGLAVEDMNSANGVYRRLRHPHTLHHGEVVLMGRQMFRFYHPAAATAPPKTDSPTIRGTASSVGIKVAESKDTKSAAVSGPPAELIRILPGGVEENHYPLPPGEHVLGRTRGTINFPDDAYLSGTHAKIISAGGKYTLEDMQAVNGTFIGVRSRVTLSDGDIILLGHQLLRVTSSAP